MLLMTRVTSDWQRSRDDDRTVAHIDCAGTGRAGSGALMDSRALEPHSTLLHLNIPGGGREQGERRH
jgi:hypothetical protein